jgi:hypothetical protein
MAAKISRSRVPGARLGAEVDVSKEENPYLGTDSVLIDRSTKRLSKTLRRVNIAAAAGSAPRFAAGKLSVNWRCQGLAPVVPERPVARP